MSKLATIVTDPINIGCIVVMVASALASAKALKAYRQAAQ